MRDKGSETAFGDTWSGSIVTAAKQENYDLLLGFARRTSGNYFAGTKGTEIYYDKDFRGNPRRREISPFKHGDEVFGTSQDVTSFLAKGTLRWGDGHRLETGYIYYNNNYGELNETALSFSVGTGIRFPAAQPYISETTTHTLRARYSYDPSGNDLIALKAGLWMTDVQTVNKPAEKSIRTYGGDISNRAKFHTSLGLFQVVTGAEGIIEQGAADPGGQNVDLSNPVSEPKGERQMLGAFTRTTWSPTKWLAVDAGLRFDRYEAIPDNPAYSRKEDERVSPSATVTLTPLHGLQLFASYIEGWRPPSLRETTAGAPNNFLLPNPDLNPETSANVEFGLNVLRGDLLMAGDRFRFKAVRFHNEHQDYIVRGRPRGSPGYTWVNIDEAVFTGYEISGGYDTGNFFIEAGYTKYDKAEFCQVDRLAVYSCGASNIGQDYGIQTMPPKYTGNITAGVRLLERRLTLGASAYFFGQKIGGYDQAPDSTIAPVYYTANTIVNLFGSYQFEERLKLDFSLENVADRYYVEPLATGVIPSPGRTARFSLTMQF
jgi:hemoglobin/transferrin/lactoferrin receptor protein